MGKNYITRVNINYENKDFKKKYITRNSSPLFIAEIGSNHNGKISLAKNLLKKLKSRGQIFVKFQSWTSKSIFSKEKYKDNFFLRMIIEIEKILT